MAYRQRSGSLLAQLDERRLDDWTAALDGLDNLILTPHVAGWSPQAIRATVETFIANVNALEQGQPLPTAL